MPTSIQKDYAIINKTAGEFLGKLTDTNIAKDIILSAEMGGIMLLRASKVDLSNRSSNYPLSCYLRKQDSALSGEIAKASITGRLCNFV